MLGTPSLVLSLHSPAFFFAPWKISGEGYFPRCKKKKLGEWNEARAHPDRLHLSLRCHSVSLS